jgi:uncharacterized protein (TIRG00374 family)
MNSRHGWQRYSGWFIGLLMLAALILVVTHIGELQQFVVLLRQVEPVWLFVALLLQITTYFSVAGVWYLALRQAGEDYPLLSLVPLGVAKLFSDQAMPTGGMTGIAFFITALNRRGIPSSLCMATLLLSMVAFYSAYLFAGLLSVLLLHFYHALHAWIVIVVLIFSLFAAGIPAGALWLRTIAKRELPALLMRIPGLSNLLSAIANAPSELLRKPVLVITASLLHAVVFMLDAATLWVMLRVVGMQASFWAVFPGFVVASMAATIGLVPLGLGTFEVTCVSMLGVMGVPVEAALTATLLLRGFTLWMPMIPGMWLARRALH